MKEAAIQTRKLVYSFVEHPNLGIILEPRVVELSQTGTYMLKSNKVFSNNVRDSGVTVADDDLQIILLLEQADQESVAKVFSPRGKRLRPMEFFAKYGDEAFYNTSLRPYLEKIMNKALLMLRGREVYRATKDNVTARAMQVCEEKCEIIFNFIRQEDGIRYFPGLYYKGKKVELKPGNSEVLMYQPSWLLCGDMLFDFQNELDGKKLKPFTDKPFIQIPRSSEAVYFKKFVVPLVEKFEVQAEGFDVQGADEKPAPQLQIVNGMQHGLVLGLEFIYGRQAFAANAGKNVAVVLESDGDSYLFRRIVRDLKAEKQWGIKLEEMGLARSDEMGYVVEGAEKDPYSCIDWLGGHVEMLNEMGFSVVQDANKKYFIGKCEVKLTVTEQADWFDVLAIVKLGRFEIPFMTLRANILAGKREYTLPDGTIAIIPAEWFTRFATLLEFNIGKNNLQIRKHHWNLLAAMGLEQSENPWLERIEALRNINTLEDHKLPKTFNGKLRNYQKTGFNWFMLLNKTGFGGCLADDMGLGKTVQTLALLDSERQSAKFPSQYNGVVFTKSINIETEETEEEMQAAMQGGTQGSLFSQNQENVSPMVISTNTGKQPEHPVNLLVLPSSLVFNWVNEAKKFTPKLRIYVHLGGSRLKHMRIFRFFDVIITTYGIARVDADMLGNFPWHYIILDESQMIKNADSQTAKALKNIKSRHRLVLTGTPVENSITDLWSQMNFVNPGILGSFNYFHEHFVIPIERENDPIKRIQLKEMIEPFILRRTKEQVTPELPEMNEMTYYCDMTTEQEKLYEKTKSVYRNKILDSITTFGFARSKMQILKGLIMLRQIANHPLLVENDFKGNSGKFDDIMMMLETVIAEDHKVLIFSQFVKHLRLMRKHLKDTGVEYCYLDGSMNQKDRMQNVERFQNDKGVKLFLISLRAGGFGLNLTAADYAFIADPWWNPAVEKQALARIHRIGQDKSVFTYKFITRGTVEEKILKLQARKLELASDIISVDNAFFNNLKQEELDELLD